MMSEVIDPEIAPLVKALNDAGLETLGSCAGHGERQPYIDLADGRVVVIYPGLVEFANWTVIGEKLMNLIVENCPFRSEEHLTIWDGNAPEVLGELVRRALRPDCQTQEGNKK